MAINSNILSFKAPDMRVTLSAKAKRIVGESRKVAERTLPKLMNGLFEKLDDALYEMADKSATDQLQSAYFDAMRVLRRHRERIQVGFVDGVLEDYDRFWRVGPQDLSIDRGREKDADLDLALVDEDELEQSLAVTNLVSKGENRYQRELYILGRRFGFLAGDVEVTPATNPFGPTGICSRFHSVIREVELDIHVRLVIYKLFDKQVMNYVGGLYEEINALLGRSGIMPKPTARIKRGQTAPSPASLRRDANDSEAQRDSGRPSSGDYSAEGGGAELFHTLQELLGPYRMRMGRGDPATRQDLPTVETTELLGVLSNLQYGGFGYADDSDWNSAGQFELRVRLADALKLERNGEANRSLGKLNEDTLDVISMLFDFLLDGPSLPDAMKALISRLQIPMLKVAIMDKTFFSRKQHPARHLLNDLAQAAMGWSDDGDRSENSLYGRIESIVNRIVEGFGDDPVLFDELNEEFAVYMERERRGAKIAEERTNQVTRGKEQLSVAKKMVSEEIERRLGHHPRLPLVVHTLLEDGWKDVLLLSYLRQGPESGNWTENLRVTDRLLWSVEPKGEYEQRQELLRAIPDLLRRLREGLNGISYDQHKMARIFKELQACHIACLRAGGKKKSIAADEETASEDVWAERGAAAQSDGGGGDVHLSADSGFDAIQHDHFTEMAENLAVGSWLELREEDGRQIRVKLSWKSDVSDVYIFVNRKGVKVLEMTRVGVAKLFRNQSAEILEDIDVPIMDRALDAMLKTLKTSEESAEV